MGEEFGSIDREPHPGEVLKTAAKRANRNMEDFYVPDCGEYVDMMNIGGADPSEKDVRRHIELWGAFP